MNQRELDVLSVGGVANMTYAKLIGLDGRMLAAPVPMGVTSSLCKQSDLTSDAYRYWCQELKVIPFLHRKSWELMIVCQALFEAGMLEPGRRGLAFGVGKEKLPSLFAQRGCEILATDQSFDSAVRGGWSATQQHAANVEALAYHDICPLNEFRSRVDFREVDMNDIPERLTGQFDFCWSTCSFEHLGSLERGLKFVENSMKTLKPRGVSVHTTEYNLSSNTDTLEMESLSIYRKRDMEELTRRLTSSGHSVLPWNFDHGSALTDNYVDLPPYRYEPHVKLMIDRFVCTSCAIIVRHSPI